MIMSLHTQKLPRKDTIHEDADIHELYRTKCSYYILGEQLLSLSPGLPTLRLKYVN